jgi:hypothetical protein
MDRFAPETDLLARAIRSIRRDKTRSIEANSGDQQIVNGRGLMRIAHIVASILIVALGLLHCAFTFRNYYGISYDAAWFLGTGFAIVLADFINIATNRDQGGDKFIWTMALITNAVFLIGFGFAVCMMRQPQVLFGAVLFTFTSAYSFLMGEASDDRHSTRR